jgi:hypothetical protein
MYKLNPSGDMMGQPSFEGVLSEGSDPSSALIGTVKSPNVLAQSAVAKLADARQATIAHRRRRVIEVGMESSLLRYDPAKVLLSARQILMAG